MPLVRFELKNEYGLGDSRLYQGSRKKVDDPSNILGGFTVSGLVGILRQLGDLAEFAAVVFNDVHQQVTSTTARGCKVLNRVRKIEEALPQFEKAVQEQKSHIHFAYITGCDWHAKIQTGKSDLFGSDLPEYVMDSYEECHEPPRLHLLDKFDSAGAGACLKRYSDPSYLRRVVSSSETVMVGRAHNGMKAQRKKKQRLRGRNGLDRHSVHMTLHARSLSSSAQYSPVVTDELRFSVDDASISDTLSISDFTNELTHFSSDKGSGCLEVKSTPLSMSKELYDDGLSVIEAETKQNVDCTFHDYSKVSDSDYVLQELTLLQNSVFSTPISSHEKTEMAKSVNQMLFHDIPEDALNSPKTVEHGYELSNRNYETNGLEMQMKLVSRSLIWDETATMACGKGVSSTYSATCDVKNETMEPTSPILADDISPSRFPDLDRGQISELTSQIDKDIDETNGLGSNVQTNFDYETGESVLWLPHLNYEAMKCEVNTSPGVGTQPTPSIDGVDGDISPFRAHDSDFLILTVQTSSQQCEITGTEMLNLENALPNTMIEINDLAIQLGKHMDAPGGLNSEVETKFDYQSGQGVILLPHLDYFRIESEVYKMVDVGGDIIPFRPQGSELFINPETSNQQCEMTGAERSNQETFSLNTMKMVLPSSAGREIIEHVSQSDKHMNATNALDSEVQANFEHQTGRVILLSNQNYDGMECEINKIPRLASTCTCIDDIDGEIAYESCTSIMKKFSPQVCDHLQPADSAEFAYRLHNPVENVVCKSLSSGSTTGNDSEAITSTIPSRQAVVIDRVSPKQSSSQDSFAETSAKSCSQIEVLCEHKTEREVESETDSSGRLTEYQSSMEKVIGDSKLIGPDIETRVASFSSSDDYSSPLQSDMITCNTVDNMSSTLTSDANPLRHPNHAFQPSNESVDFGGNMSAQLTNTSVILPSNVIAATAVEFQGFPVDSHGKSSINIWTNGGLLGLEPSKPPDLSVPNVCCSDQIYDNRSSADSQRCILGNLSESRNLFLEADKLNYVASFPEKDNFTDLDINGVKGNGRTFSKSDVYSKSDSESNLSEKNKIGSSVGFSSLAHRLPVNSLQRKLSNTGISSFCELINKDVHKFDDTSILNKHKERPRLAISSTQLHKLEKKDITHGYSEKFVSSSLDFSGYQSPPLEHMEVSFQLMDNSDASKLRLEFCNIHLQGDKGDLMFPSFQLISESVHPPMDDALESDDDTFCRSCPYSSDDLLTLYSESDAETWGEDELDISNRIEATCSISSSIDDKSSASRVSQVNRVTKSKHGSDELSFNLSDILYCPNTSSLEISQRLLNTKEPTELLLPLSNELESLQLSAVKPSSVGSLHTERSTSHQSLAEEEPGS